MERGSSRTRSTLQISPETSGARKRGAREKKDYTRNHRLKLVRTYVNVRMYEWSHRSVTFCCIKDCSFFSGETQRGVAAAPGRIPHRIHGGGGKFVKLPPRSGSGCCCLVGRAKLWRTMHTYDIILRKTEFPVAAKKKDSSLLTCEWTF